MQAEISVQDLSFTYPPPKFHEVFRSAAATFTSARISAVVGKSGSGKSTLLKLLAGLVEQEAHLNCISYGLERLSPGKMAQDGRVSLCLQKPACLPWATVYRNVTLPFRLQRRPINEDYAVALIERFGLTQWKDRYPHELSVGMLARVALARAFVTHPDVVLLDEPFSSLDITWKEQLYSFLLHAQGEASCTVVLVTHDLLEALFLADNIYVIEGGAKCLKSVLTGNPLKHAGSDLSFSAFVDDNRLPELFKELHETIAL